MHPSVAVVTSIARAAPWPALILTMLLCADSVQAQSGVSDDRVNLPDGPGSIGGIGENVSVMGNMGAMSLAVPFRVLPGFEGVTPELGLRYSSSEGSTVVGIGWSMDVPSIERMTARGLPEYTADDAFVVEGGEQLVRVSQTMTTAVYRARYEKGFVRYTWRDLGDGKAGYFTAEYPDGTISYFGADRAGTADPTSRVTQPKGGGVFRYMLVETVDPFGHRVHYTYVSSNGYPLLDSVDYVHDKAGAARFAVRFVYGARPDTISDCKPGFNLQLTQRLSSVRVFSSAELIRQYDLDYETEASSGGMSRLASVTEKGRGGVVYPIKPTFGYSQTLGGACTTNCQKPFMVDMGTLAGGLDLRAGTATLLDINGDSLPDVLDTAAGMHRFYISRPSADGKPSFGNPVVTSKAATSSFQLINPSVQVLDVNGDGFTDMVSSRTGGVLCNIGAGDWNGTACLANGSLDFELQDDASDVGVSDPLHVRFFDYDNDKRIDLLRTTSIDATDVRRDTGMGFAPVAIAPIGEVFDEGALQLADMNGDGLLDPVVLSDTGSLRYRLNFGLGRWDDWQTVTVAGLGQADLTIANLQDLNGDGLDDIVVVVAGTVKVLLNRNGARFDAPIVLDGSKIDGALPETGETTSVLFADMNGNGSDDVVYVSSTGHVQFLDLFPVKPNLLARIENAIGNVQTVSYGTSLAELARDGSWAFKLNYAMNVVKKVDQWVTLTGNESGGLHEVMTYDYHDGFYDGAEKQFRGYAKVDENELADALDSQQPSLTVSSYDVGATDPYFNGLLLRSDTFAVGGASPVPMRSVRSEYRDCAVGGVPITGLSFPVRHVCETTRNEVEQEGAASADWATVQTLMEYDNYGNISRQRSLGVVNMGPPEAPTPCRACIDADDAACGPTCTGDETYTETVYVSPEDGTGGKWFLNHPAHHKVYGVDGGPLREVAYYYDGEPFVGLPEGKLGLGQLTRESRSVTATPGDVIDDKRNQFDADGNEVVILDPLGSPSDSAGHRSLYQYDGYGLNLTVTELATSDASGPYTLRREYSYEAVFNEISEATAWMVSRGGSVTSSRDTNRYRYDEFGRIAKIIEPGDSEDAPSTAYTYELADPISRIQVASRSAPGVAFDRVVYHCADGRGRTVQTITSVSDGRYLADGFRTLNSRGAEVRAYQPYELTTPTCAKAAPDGVAFTAYGYDSLSRAVAITHPDAALYGGKASTERVEYGVLVKRDFDQEDTAEGGAHVNTPLVRHYDGEGRVLSIERSLGSSSAVTRLRYDSLDNLKGYIDASGNVRTQEFDLLQRAVKVTDPNAGVSTFGYDAASNLVRRQSASGDVVRYAHDGANRLNQIWSEPDRDGTLVTHTYDVLPDCKLCSGAAGELVEVRYPVMLGEQKSVGFDRFGFDARRRTIYEARSLEGHLFETNHSYDGLDRRVLTTYPDGQMFQRTYDGVGRLLSIPGVLTSNAYDTRGQLKTEVLANGVSTSWDYDDLIRLKSHKLVAGAQDVVFDLAIARDRVGNLTSGTDSAPGSHIKRGFGYGYDAWYRLTSADLAKGAPDAETMSLKYDGIDNVLSRDSSKGLASAAQLGALTYASAHPNATSGFAGLVLGYSADGDLEQRGNLTLGWDYQGRLSRTERAGQLAGLYAYGEEQERVVKDELGHVVYYVSDEFEVRDGISAAYPRDGVRLHARSESAALATRVLTDVDADSAITVADALLAQNAAKASEVPRLLAASAKRLLLGPAVDISFLHQDYIDDVIVATDATGKVTAERSFYEYGAERASSGFIDDHGFSGQELDSSSGLVHYEYRNLDPQSGRWASADPEFEIVDATSIEQVGQATTSYAFLANHYGNDVDPDGLVVPKTKSAKAKVKTKAQREKRMAKLQKKHAREKTKQGLKALHISNNPISLLMAREKPPTKAITRDSKAKAQAKADKKAAKAAKAPKKDLLYKLGTKISPYSGRAKHAGDGKPPRDGANPRAVGAKALGAIGLAVGSVGAIGGYLGATSLDNDASNDPASPTGTTAPR